MGHKEETGMAPPSLVTGLTIWMFTLFWLIGKARDFLGRYRFMKGRTAVQGRAPALDPQADFYQRRVFSRMKDLWNRPIASAPDAWVDVIERSDLSYTSGTKPIKLLPTTKRCLNLGSYNYLGFAAADAYCTPRVQATIKDIGVSTCSARRAAGTTSYHEELEVEVAKFVGKEAALTFGMGFATNSATLPALVGKGCLILSDKLNHTSIVVGARSSGAHIKVFKHNDATHLEMVLRDSIARGQPKTGRPWKKVLIVIEGIYSMEGVVCALPEIIAVKKKFGAYLFLDEAHSIGAMGAHGKGVCEHWGVDPADVDIMMGTFTKSFGSCGGYIAASRATIDFLLRHSPAHLYATAMSPAAAQQALSAIKLLNGDDGTTRGVEKVRQLHRNANDFRRRLIDMGLSVLGDWDSPVMPLMIYFPGKLPAVSRLCLERSVAMVVVGFPATEMTLARARVCISASHTKEDLDYAAEVLDHVMSVCCCKYGRAPEPRPHPQLLMAPPTPKLTAATPPRTSTKEQQQVHHSRTTPNGKKQQLQHNGQQQGSNGKRGRDSPKCPGFTSPSVVVTTAQHVVMPVVAPRIAAR